MLVNSSILVTGASGFIGIPLCNYLVSLNFNVIAVVRSSSSLSRLHDRVYIVHVSDINAVTDWSALFQVSDKFSFVFGDVVDCVVHCAGRAHVLSETQSEFDNLYYDINAGSTALLARQAAAFGVKRFVFLSSIGVNGSSSSLEMPFTSFDVPSPDTAYSISKLEAELALKSICAKSDMDFVIVRPPLVYGPFAKGNFQRIIDIVSSGLPLPFGSINNLRSLISVDNIVEFIALCISHPSAPGNVFLVSDGRDISSACLFRLLSRYIKSSSFVFSLPRWLLRLLFVIMHKYPEYLKLTSSLVVDDSQARLKLGWSPQYSLEVGLKRAVNSSIDSGC